MPAGPAAVVALPDEASDVGAGRERPLALAAQHDDADVVVERLELRPERLDDPRVDGVHRRVVEPDGLDHDGTVLGGEHLAQLGLAELADARLRDLLR